MLVDRWRSAWLCGGLLTAVAATTAGACTGAFCSSWSSSMICDDFDTSSSVAQEGLQQQTSTGGGTVTLDNQNAYTPPNSALATTSAFDGGAGSSVQLGGALWANAQPPPAVITCDLEIQPGQLSDASNDTASVLNLAIMDGAGLVRSQLSIFIDTGGNLSFQQALGDPLDGGADPPDSAVPDSGSPDTGPADTGSPDTGSPDSGSLDGGTASEGGTRDTGSPDTGSPDTGSRDAALADALPDSSHPPLDGGGNSASGAVFGAVQPGAWTLLELVLTTNNTGTQYSVTAGGVGTSGSLAQPLPSPMSATLLVGPVDRNGASSGWSVYYDNVVCH